MAKRILVKSSSGEIGTVEASELPSLVGSGYSPLTPEEAKEHALQKEYGEGLGNELQAFGEGALRGVSIGASDAVLRGLGVSAEGLRERKERSPIASTTGEVAGIAAPLAVSALAGPEAPAAVIASRTPVGLLARGSAALGEAGASALQGTRAAQILGRSASPAIGSAIEGAAYGLGQSVSEEALGSPGLNAERLLTNVGLGGLFSGALGGLFGAFAKATPETLIDDALRESGEIAVANPKSLDEVAKASGIDEGYIKSLGRRRAGADATEAAATELGAPVTAGMIGGKEAQILEDLVRNAPSAPAQAYARQLDEGFEIAQKAVADSFGETSGKSMAEVGQELADNFIQKFEARTQPFEAGFDRVRESTKNIVVSDKSKLRIAKNIEKLKVNNYSAIEKGLIDDVISNLNNTTSLEGLRSIKTGISKAAATEPQLWGIVGDISERIDGFIERAAKKAIAELPPGSLREEGRSVFRELDRLKKEYKPFREGINKLSSALFGGKRINGPRHFLSEMEKLKPEAFAKKLFTKENSRHLAFMAENFPEETRLLTRYVKDEMFRKARQIKGDMARMNSIFKQVDSLEREAKAFLFTPDELNRIKAAKTYLSSFPAKYNGPNTAHTLDRLSFWSSPVSAAGITARDFTMIQALKGLGPKTEAQVKALSKVERIIQDTARTIEDKSRAIVTGTKSIMKEVPAGALGIGLVPDNRDEKDTIKLINDLKSDPERMIDRLDEATKGVSAFAPQIGGAINYSASQAVEFLASKVPQRPNMGPLSPQYEFSQAEISKFNRYADVVEAPFSIFDQIESGTLTMEGLEALSAVYPGVYSDMKMAILEHIADDGEGFAEKMPYSTKLSLSMFLGEDMMASLSQPLIAANQMTIMGAGSEQARSSSQNQAKVSKEGISTIAKGDRMMTQMQRVGAGMEGVS